MPRQLRQFEINGIYHVVNRGVEKRNIFLKNQDYHRFMLGLEFCNTFDSADLWSLIVGSDPTKLEERLKEKRSIKKNSLTEVLAFALMPNHFHFIFREINKNGISQFMQKIGGYSTYFNKQYNRVGSLFQSRYKAIHVKSDKQLHTIFAYVHTNPIELWEPSWKEHKVKNLESAIKKLNNYHFSSYNDYTTANKFRHIISRDFFLGLYGGENGCKKAIEDWISFKANQTELGPEIIE